MRSTVLEYASEETHIAAARDAAAAIWLKRPAAPPVEPRHPIFARRFLDECTRHLGATAPLVQDALDGAARGAEGVNVEPFQGLMEVVQNADDQGAKEVRLRLRQLSEGEQMLVVHDGRPVEYHQVSAMMLPYVSTKVDDAVQRGRFGIGLKTLRRISTALRVHSVPFHFGGGTDGGVSIRRVEPEPAIEGFYDPAGDTMLVLDLNDQFSREGLASWFERWTDDGLVFLENVRRFVWDEGDGEPAERKTVAGAWSCVEDGSGLETRQVAAGNAIWRVYRAQVPTAERRRAHKTTADSTAISVATCGTPVANGLFVGLPTRIPTSLSFAIDAQFDPSQSRETILDNGWNRWILERCGEVLASAARDCLLRDPALAWSLVPIRGDGVGNREEPWLAERFREAFAVSRSLLIQVGEVAIGGSRVKFDGLAYEAPALEDLLLVEDVAALAPGHTALPHAMRDAGGRWRAVLANLEVANELRPRDLLASVAHPIFETKPPGWWIRAATTIVSGCSPDEVFGAALWLREDGLRVACRPKGSALSLVQGCELPPLSRRLALFDRLHPTFGAPGTEADAAREWLATHAAYAVELEPADELKAFAERFRDDPQRLDEAELREIRDLLHPYPDRTAGPVGKLLAGSILIEAIGGETGRLKVWAHPDRVYLPKSIDKDNPNWPRAAADLPGMLWAAQGLEEKLKTGLGRQRKAADGLQARGARRFLSIMGSAAAPRLERCGPQAVPGDSRRNELRAIGATHVSEDVASPDLARVIAAICDPKRPRKERRERALSLMRTLSREWSSRYASDATIVAWERKRKRDAEKGRVSAEWLCMLKDAAWVPVGRDRFVRPAEAALRNQETLAVLRTADRFVSGLDSGDVSEQFAVAIGLTVRIKASDIVRGIREMRDRPDTFDLRRLRLAYQQLARLCPKLTWGRVDDLAGSEFRSAFDEGQGLCLVLQRDGEFGWRRTGQVRRGPRVLPDPELYVIDPDADTLLWSTLGVGRPSLGDCCEHLRERAARAPDASQDGTLVEIYVYMASLLDKADAPRDDAVRRMPLACGTIWWARRPILLVEQREVRERLAAARPELRFWRPPCDPKAIGSLVAAASVTRIEPSIQALRHDGAEDRGLELSARFRAAVDHLSDSLIRTRPSLRKALAVSWDDLREIELHVHEETVPVEISHPTLRDPVRTDLSVHLARAPLALHASEASLASRLGVGEAIASLFPPSTDWPIYLEWESAWAAAKDEVAAALRMEVDDDEHARRLREAAEQIGQRKGGTIQLKPRRKKPGEAADKQPVERPRELKELQPGISQVLVVDGSGHVEHKGVKRQPLRRRRPPPGPAVEPHLPGASYSNHDLEQFGWDVVSHVLVHGGGKELEDFRRAHGVGADGAIDWEQFVELKASGRSMSTSVELSPAEFRRAVERRNQYVLALVHGAEKGQLTRVKLIFDPVARATVRETEGVRLTGLQNAPGIEITMADDGGMGPTVTVGSL